MTKSINLKPIEVAQGCCCFAVIKSETGQKIIIQLVTFTWNSCNNTLLYFNTIDKAFKRLGLIANKFSALETTADKVGFGFTTIFLAGYFIGNQRKYGHDALVAIYPNHPDKLTSNRFWTGNDLANALTKTYCNTLTAMETFKQFSGWSGAVPAGIFSAWFNYEANSAYYLRTTESYLANCLPDGAKKAVRYLVVSGFSLSSALFYTMSLAYFRGHLDGSEKSCFEAPDFLDYLTMLGCAISVLSITPATLARYNSAMAKRLGEANSELPSTLKHFCENKLLALTAAVCKTSIALTSTYAFLNDYKSSVGLKVVLCSLGWTTGAVVQRGMFNKAKTTTNGLLKTLTGVGETADYQAVDKEERAVTDTKDQGITVVTAPSSSNRRNSNRVVEFFRWVCSGCCPNRYQVDDGPSTTPSPPV